MLLTGLLLDYFDQKEGRIITTASFFHALFSNWNKDKLKEMDKDTKFLNYRQEFCSNLIRKTIHYSNTKLANIIFTNYLSDFLAKNKKYSHIKTASVNPGVVFTEFARGFFNLPVINSIPFLTKPIYAYISKTAFSGAQTNLHLCYVNIEEFVCSGYYNNCKLAQTSLSAKDVELRDLVIKYSMKLIRKNKELNNIPF